MLTRTDILVQIEEQICKMADKDDYLQKAKLRVLKIEQKGQQDKMKKKPN